MPRKYYNKKTFFFLSRISEGEKEDSSHAENMKKKLQLKFIKW